MKERNQNLDLIKCIACLGVVGLHSVGMVNYTIYYLCDFSVPLFFMVNGFLMFSKEEISYGYAFRKILNLIKVVVLWNLLIMLPVLVFRRKIVNPVRKTIPFYMVWFACFSCASASSSVTFPWLRVIPYRCSFPRRCVSGPGCSSSCLAVYVIPCCLLSQKNFPCGFTALLPFFLPYSAIWYRKKPVCISYITDSPIFSMTISLP